jgi:transcriptional regulator with XRE-family HTH domain
MTLKDVSEDMHTSIAYLSEIERGIWSPTVLTLLELANVYEITLSELLIDIK